MKIKIVYMLVICISCKLFPIDINNTICFIGFNSSNNDPVTNEIITKSNEIIVDNFTKAGNVSLVNLANTNISKDDLLNASIQYPYIIYGAIDSSHNEYTFEIIIKDNKNEAVSKHYRSASCILDVFPICDELYEEMIPDFSKIVVSKKQNPSTSIDCNIDTINRFKVHEWFFNATPKDEINSDTFWTGKLKYISNRKNEKNAAITFDHYSINKLNTTYELNNDFTISLWFLLTNQSFDTYGRIYDCMQWGQKTGYNIICEKNLKCINFSYFGEDGITHDVMTNEKLHQGRWYNVIATFKDGTSCIYLDGKLQQINSSNHIINTSKRYISIGNGNDDYTKWPFYGKLDDLIIFSKALTQQEVAILYQTF